MTLFTDEMRPEKLGRIPRARLAGKDGASSPSCTTLGDKTCPSFQFCYGVSTNSQGWENVVPVPEFGLGVHGM